MGKISTAVILRLRAAQHRGTPTIGVGAALRMTTLWEFDENILNNLAFMG